MSDYCPIKLEKKCKATNKLCDRVHCVERIRAYQPQAMHEKYEKWEVHRRGDLRINQYLEKENYERREEVEDLKNNGEIRKKLSS